MASIKMAGGSLLSTVTDTAQAVSGIMNTVNAGVMILHSKTTEILNNQEDLRLINRNNYRVTAIKNSAMEQSRINENIRNYVSGDAVKQQEFNDYVAELESLFVVKDN